MDELEQGEGRPGRGWHGPFTWTGLLALGWVLCELTTQPALGAVAVCVKFGWEDFRTALWLRRRDHRRARGRACFWLYTANGLWKVAGVAFLMSFAMYSLSTRRAPGQFREVLPGILLTVLVGVVLSAAAALRAVGLAWRHRVLLWLHGNVCRACRADVWPPPDGEGSPDNGLGGLLQVLLLLTFFPLLSGLLLFSGILLVDSALAVFLTGLLAVLVGLPVLALRLRDLAVGCVGAESAAECWGADPLARP